VRTAVDVPALHVPWYAGVAAGLLQISDGEVRSGSALAGWPPGDEELLAGWLAGLRAVCAAGSDPRCREGVSLLALAMLVVLDQGGTPSGTKLWPTVDAALRDLCDLYDKPYSRVWDAAYRYSRDDTLDPVAGLFALLAEFGAVTGSASRPRITPLGRWALAQLRESLPEPVSPQLLAGDLLVRLATFERDAERYHVASQWLAARTTGRAAREILAAADQVPPSLRFLAVGLAESLGDDALPVWQEMAEAPRVGPHVRAVLAAYGRSQGVSEAERRWLAVDRAAAALADSGPDEALTCVYEALPGPDLDSRLAAVRASGHPDAETLARSLAEFAESGRPAAWIT
jgi:hypothetical protein